MKDDKLKELIVENKKKWGIKSTNNACWWIEELEKAYKLGEMAGTKQRNCSTCGELIFDKNVWCRDCMVKTLEQGKEMERERIAKLVEDFFEENMWEEDQYSDKVPKPTIIRLLKADRTKKELLFLIKKAREEIKSRLKATEGR